VARELGVNVDQSTSGSSNASAAAWDDELEDGTPSPEALRARMSFLAETMTSVLRGRAGGRGCSATGVNGRRLARTSTRYPRGR
jgi:hypothetical protein